MKRVALGLVAIALIAAAAFLATGGLAGAGTSKAEEKTPTAEPVKAGGKVVAEAKVVPVRSSGLSLSTGGVVAEVLVAEGDKVEAGQPILRLDSSKQKAAVAQAEVGVRKAEAALDQVKAGPRPQEIEVAEAAVAAAEAQLAKIQQGAQPEEIAAAQAAVNAAKAQLAKAQQGPDNDLVVAAKSDLAKLKAGPTAEDVKAAELAVDQAKSARWAAQIERDGICGSAYAPKFQCDAGNARIAAAETAITTAENNLAKVKAGPRAEDIATAEARLQQLLKGPDADAIASARAQVEQAQARLDALKAPARPADLGAAQAEIRRAKANLELAKAGARPEAVAAAQTDVESARAALDQAKTTLAETELRAPFAGTVASLDVKVGESVTPGQASAKLADVSTWQIETTDLTELNAVRIPEGSPAVITFDAVPGLEIPGTIARIRPVGEKKQGDMTYTAIVKPERQDARMLWNMTATVSVEAK